MNLTCVTKSEENHGSSQQAFSAHVSQYSAREVSPPTLLLQQALRAHRIFLLHHGASLTDIWSRLPRQKFCGFLKRFWDDFLTSWDVMLHGNPSVDIYNGLKLSAGGELGFGIGEEDWGSGERELLEEFIKRTDGLVDLIVARYENTSIQTENRAKTKFARLGDTGENPKPSDGVIFSGIGRLTRYSVRNLSAWIESLAVHGNNAYGVQANPTANPQRKRSRKENLRGEITGVRVKSEQKSGANEASVVSEHHPAIPAPIVRLKSPNRQGQKANGRANQQPLVDPSDHENPAVGTEIMKYLTLGVYGSRWGIPSGRPTNRREVSSTTERNDGLPSRNSGSHVKLDALDGYFLIGLLGSLEEDLKTEDKASEQHPDSDDAKKSSNRILVRYVFVERNKEMNAAANPEARAEDIYNDRLRVVVYVRPPFVFTFLFEQQTDALAISSFYRSLHHQLGPLQRPLLNSTDPAKVAQRVWEAACTKRTVSMSNSQPIHDLVYDPICLTLRTTIPDIPETDLHFKNSRARWTRMEALSVHSQILNTYISTRRSMLELERTCKTSRCWWIVWMRLPHPPGSHMLERNFNHREAFLIRKSSDYVAPNPRNASSGLGLVWGEGGESTGSTKLAEGIGVDARQYIDGLLSLNR